LESCAFLANAAQVGGAISIACRVELHTAQGICTDEAVSETVQQGLRPRAV